MTNLLSTHSFWVRILLNLHSQRALHITVITNGAVWFFIFDKQFVIYMYFEISCKVITVLAAFDETPKLSVYPEKYQTNLLTIATRILGWSLSI